MTHHRNGAAETDSITRRLAIPILLMIVAFTFLAATHTGKEFDSPNRGVSGLWFDIAATLSWAAVAFLTTRLIDVLVWRGAMQAHGHAAPHLLQKVVAALIWFLAACAVTSFVFGQSLTAIIAASSVTMGVAGFALQRPILDAFSGIVLALQQPFKMGDWLQVDDKGNLGRVTEMNWRAVSLVTPDEVTFVIPNGQFITGPAKIFSRPEHFFRDEIQVTLPYGVTTHHGKRILLGAANQVAEIAAVPRKPIVSIQDYTDRGILWRLFYWCPDPGRLPVFRFLVHQNIQRNLHYAGIEVPAPMLDLRRLSRKEDDSEELGGIDPMIKRVSLFAALTADELRHLSSHAVKRLARAGTPLLKQGDPGDSLFILRDGVLEVRISQNGQPEIAVGQIRAGDVFGEMSVLLGEPRTATILPVTDSMVTEITRDTLSHLMHTRPELASYLAEILAERQANNNAKLTAAPTADSQSISLFDQMANRIMTLFGIKKTWNAQAGKTSPKHNGASKN